ncbi:LacI family DNA-binding transcriptional regulator [Sphingomonas abietis]|uniref:LacI family DNA-binding transcriptional regulator n=1 Tax=Sphingomonas abietis TaxID=3012344 RepID=A0ABY7NLK7_9SPHN|nr:LacI family DNA-binding transcriptional regulator [Sphingomonas abietis]WBO21508.1 LacI family DNA-binding transcriptional regulator [Sphingomonas abietis]
MTITIKHVAERAGVSTKTVSRVMNGEAHVRTAVREAVMRVVEELGYRPNAFARSLSSARSYLLGLFLDDPAWSGYAAGMQRGALIRCRERHYHLVVEPLDTGTDGWEPDLMASIASLRLDGAILAPPLCAMPPLLDMLDGIGLPYVLISPGKDHQRSGSVDIDEEGAAFAMTRHLIDLGHRDIGLIEGIPSHAATPKRRAGFLSAMHGAGLPVDRDRIVPGDFTFRGGLDGGEALLGRATRPTAIFASNDDMALGVSAAAARRGIAVPGQLSIAGFDDGPTARVAWPPITTIRQPVGEMAAAAVDILIDPSYRDAPTDPRFRRELPYELIVRGSTAAPPPL